MKSVIYLAEKVPNLDRRFGAAPEYYPATIIIGDRVYKGLFTPSAISEAIERGNVNTEDFPPARAPWWRRLIDWLKTDV